MQSIVRTAHRYAPEVAAGASAPSALRCPKKSSRCSLARFFRPLRVLRLAASATGGARLRTPYPSPVAGEGPSGQIAAYSGLRLGSVTFCASLLGKSQSLPPCGARKNLHAARLLDFFDRYGCSASLHPPLAALGSASPSTATPSPPNLHNKSQLQFPRKIRYLCDLRPISSHNINFPLKKVKY